MENINKIWGERRRLFLNDKVEIDLLYLKKDTFCSTHNHIAKINQFTVITGEVEIITEYGTAVLKKNDTWTILPHLTHKFKANVDSIAIEIAYVEKGDVIDVMDIDRNIQGGKIINGEEISIPELKKRGLLNL